MRWKRAVIGVVLLVGGAAAGFLISGSEQALATVTLSHFQCYPIVDGANPIHTAKLDDQFTNRETPIRKALLFCSTVTKTVLEGNTTANTGDHLVCYLIQQEIDPPRIEMRNQLHTMRRDLGKNQFLCVPTGKFTTD